MHSTTLPLLRPPDAPNATAMTLTEVVREQNGDILTGTVQAGTRGPYAIQDGVLDLIGHALPPVSLAQRSNFLWPTSTYYEQVWRTRSLTLLADEPFPVRRELDLLNRWVQPERGGLYVDVGTSHGLYARNLAHVFEARGATGTVVALDIAPAMLKRAGELIAQKGYTTVDRVRARAQALPVADGTVAGVTNGGTFNEMGAQHDALCEVRRVLAPDGVSFTMSLVAAHTRVGARVQSVLGAALGLIFPTRGETNVMYNAAGLTITDQEQDGIVLLTRATPK